MSAPDDELHFDVHPSVVFQLGADLISDDCQALIELVKNSYDAGATYSHIEINTREQVESVFMETYFRGASGYIKISDDGLGMDLEDIKRGWLILSDSRKRKLKASGGIRPGVRTPLGDKGLGRLGSQRLAQNLEIVTVPQNSSVEYHVGLSWEEFRNHQALHDVPIKGPQSLPASNERGMIAILSDLLNPERWRGSSAKVELEDRFSELVSPFERIEAFSVVITVDGVKLDTARVGRKIRDEADAHFKYAFDGVRLAIEGRIKLRLLEPSDKTRQRIFDDFCKRDNGQELMNELKARSQGRSFSLASASAPAWFAKFNGEFLLDDLDRVATLPDNRVANPGPFHGEVYSFDLGREREPSAFSGVQELRQHMKRLAGVRVYRDGFGIRVDTDFLRLAQAWTRGKSWYGLKPGNTMGFVSISAKDNPDLVETTDREGFKKTPYLANFEALLARFVGFTHDVLQFSRREAISFCDAHIQLSAGVDASMSSEELAQRISEHLEVGAELKGKVGKLTKTLAASARELERASNESGQWLFRDTAAARRTREAFSKVQAETSAAGRALDELASFLEQAPQIRDAHAVLQAQIERFHDRLSQAYETMGVGLTAEALVHEIAVIAGGLGERVGAIRNYLRSTGNTDERVLAFVRHVTGAIAALRKQLGHLDPSLRYVRERREVIELDSFLSELKQYHESRWRDGSLAIKLSSLPSKERFDVEINRGKLTQVFDNLILNSEYWLREEIRRGFRQKGEIRIELKRPFVWLSDDGRGVDLSVEANLFEAFVTTKAGGRGLGLFIVREFLESEGASIGLCQERNDVGRLFKFVLDLSGMAYGKADK